MHEMQQNVEIFRHNIHTEKARNIDVVTIESLSFSSISSVIIMKLATGSKHERCKTAYKIDIGNGDNLVPFDIFKIPFPNTTIEQLNKSVKNVVLRIYNKTSIPQLCKCRI